MRRYNEMENVIKTLESIDHALENATSNWAKAYWAKQASFQNNKLAQLATLRQFS